MRACFRRERDDNQAVLPDTGPALIILVAFVLPGFVTVLIQDNTYRRAQDATTLDRLLRIVYYSVLTYLLLAPVALAFHIDRPYLETLYRENEDSPAELVWRAGLLILIPSLLIATATRSWDESKAQSLCLKFWRVSSTHRKPTGWDFVFQQQRCAYICVTFADGRQICGFYGEESFAAYAKDGSDLFLERVHDGMRGPALDRSAWVNARDAVWVEFYSPVEDATTSVVPAAPASKTSAAGINVTTN